MRDQPPFALSTGDPAFSPDKPATINGYLFLPATGEIAQALAAAITERDRLRGRIDDLLAANTALVLENREIKRTASPGDVC
mgnify:CR=1 FL=1